MKSSAIPSMMLVPGRQMVLFVVHLESGLTSFFCRAAEFLDGLKAASDMVSFNSLWRQEEKLEELLPWTGNV